MRIWNFAFLINSAPAKGGKWAKGLKVLAPFFAMLCLALWPMEANANPEGELFKNDIWSGVYVGVGAGAGSFDYGLWGRGTISQFIEGRCKEPRYDPDYPERGLTCPDPGPWDYIEYGSYEKLKDIHASGDDWDIFGTIQVGIDRQIGQSFVIGAFADFDLYKDSGDNFSVSVDHNRDGFSFDHLKGSLSGKVELDNVWSVGGRIGALVTPRFLLYGMGGYTQANLDGNLTFTLNNNKTVSVGLPDELHGYFVGGGGEVKLRGNLSLKIEYRYSDFDSQSASASKSDGYDFFTKCMPFDPDHFRYT